MDEKQLLIEMVQQMAQKGIDPDKPFTAELFAPIAAKYSIPEEAEFMSRFVLNVAAAHSRQEAEWTAIDLRKVRSKFSLVAKHCQGLREALKLLDEEDLLAADKAALASELLADAEVMEMLCMDVRQPAPRIVLDENQPFLQRPDRKAVAFNELDEVLAALEQAISGVELMAGKGKTGRREDATLEPLLQSAFQVYENFISQRFRLQWHVDGQPLSDAACFCVDVVDLFDPSASLQRIATAANKVRKTSKKVSNLNEVPDFIRHFLERSR